MGIRYARYATDLQAALIRTGVFITFASALWALMPLVARFNLGLGAAGYGILLAAVGLGPLIGAGIQPWLRQRAHVNELVTFAALIFAAATIPLGYLLSLPLLIFAMLIGGIALAVFTAVALAYPYAALSALVLAIPTWLLVHTAKVRWDAVDPGGF